MYYNKFLLLFTFCLCLICCDGQKAKIKNCDMNEAIGVINDLPEVKKQSLFVDSISQNKKHLSFMTDSIKNKHYYVIKTGYNAELHWETYNIFYVDKNNCNKIMVNEVISGDIISLDKWRILNKRTIPMNNTTSSVNQINFTDLFNEGTNIKFTPKDLDKNEPSIIEFKRKLQAFESTEPKAEDFNIDELSLLINNETFSNNETFIDPSWLAYFTNKYSFKQNIINKLMDEALEQEDYEAVKLLSKNYIFSQKQIEKSKNKKKYKDSLYGKLDTNEYYDPKYSKIDDILTYINNSYSKNHIQDPDGFTNLRKDKTTTSEVLQKIKSGEQIEVLDNSGDWFLVQTKDGKKGYVYRSRVK